MVAKRVKGDSVPHRNRANQDRQLVAAPPALLARIRKSKRKRQTSLLVSIMPHVLLPGQGHVSSSDSMDSKPERKIRI
jgi:hypothetical protein